MEIDQKCLPSEKLQKEIEDNPLKLLEMIRKEKEEQKTQIEVSKINENFPKALPKKKNFSYNIEKSNSKKIGNNFSKTKAFDSLKNKKYAQNKLNINNNYKYVNNINKVNTNELNNAKKSIVNNKSKKDYDNNNLSIFFTLQNTNNNRNHDYTDKNTTNISQCINNNYNNMCLKNNSEEANSTSSQSNDEDKNNKVNNNCNIIIFENNNSNDSKLLLLSNIDLLLENLKTFKGSIICQRFIENLGNNEKECSILFNNIMPHLCTIMCLEYGNYFFQKFLKILNLTQKLKVYNIIEPNFYNIATNKFGTHSIQSLIDNIQSPYELFALNKLISKNMYFLFVNNNAYHIMMKIILDFPEEQRNVLNLFLVMNAEKIITNCNGAFCINKFITHNKDLNLRVLLIKNLQKNIKELIYNKYSCINLLLILETFGIVWGKFILIEIQENFGVLCEHPVSNLFVSKVLLFLNNNHCVELKLIIWSLFKNIVLIKSLISNNNNNNIINQLIDYSDDEQKKYLFLLLNSNGNL